MIGTRIEIVDGVFHVAGTIDEHLDFRVILAAAEPVKINFAKINAVNSLGVRAFTIFMRSVGRKKIEFHGCSVPIVDMINTIPGTLGSPARPEIVKSLYVPFECASCGEEHNVLFPMNLKEVGQPTLKNTVCAKCGGKSVPLVSGDDCFGYLTNGD